LGISGIGTEAGGICSSSLLSIGEGTCGLWGIVGICCVKSLGGTVFAKSGLVVDIGIARKKVAPNTFKYRYLDDIAFS